MQDKALLYHSEGRAGKIEVIPTKSCRTKDDLSLAYTPGVASPVLAIEERPDDVYKYTAKGNLVGIITNGTAVLGLGNKGALASKPVMEGKGVLFKRFADIDSFDIEIDSQDPDEIIKVCTLLEPTFGGINLEDIKAPECFYIEETLKNSLHIPVFHDDQHGTAIISGAGLLNASELVGKDMSRLKVVINGAGAAGIACAKFCLSLGVAKKNLYLCDSKGVITTKRKEGMNEYKAFFASETSGCTLAEVMKGADVFFGLSVKGAVTKKMISDMASSPIVFAMANPDPEIDYCEAKAARPDIIMATGRSDFPNQINNVLGFPFIFRGALDTGASTINEQMKIACARGLARLARKPVPEEVSHAYGGEQFTFGPEYIIPKPFDPRVLSEVAPEVAEAAIKSGVASRTLDLDKYREDMANRAAHIQRRYGRDNRGYEGTR